MLSPMGWSMMPITMTLVAHNSRPVFDTKNKMMQSDLTMKLKQQVGTSLIEILVSMVVASLGLLGAAKLQSLAINQTTSANSQSFVAIAVDNLSAMMKSNQSFWRDAAFPDPFSISVAAAGAVTGTGAGTLATATKDCTTAADCDQAELAAFDLRAIAADFAASTTAGSFQIQRVGSAAPPLFQVTAQWNEKIMSLGGNSTKYGSGASSSSYQVLMRP